MKVTLTLIALVAWSTTDRSRCLPAEAEVKMLRSAVRQFYMDMGRLPMEEEGLAILLRKPHDWPETIEWAPYLEPMEIPTDAWGHDYVHVVDANLRAGFGIYSCGLDGITSSGGNDEDDINTWNHRRPWDDYYARLRRRRQAVELLTGLAPLIVTVAAIALIVRAVERRRNISPDGS